MLNLYVSFIIIVSLEFFSLSIVSEQLQKNMEGIAVLSLIILTVSKHLIGEKIIYHANFIEYKNGIIVILVSVFLSSFSALWLYQQPIEVTMIAQRSMYFYLLFFVLHLFNADKEFLYKLVMMIATLFSIVYFLAIIYPNIINARILEERGTFRISLPGITFVVLGVFFSLQKIVYERKFIFVFPALLFVANIIATGTRSIIGIVFLLSVFFFFRSLLKKNIFSTFVAFSGLMVIVFLLYDTIDFVIDLFKNAVSGQEGNFQIRLFAITFLFSDLFKSNYAFVLGNGFASQLSSYGQQLLYLKNNYGIYLSDLGIAGDYIRYGILYLVGVGIIFYGVLKTNYSVKNSFVLYSFYFLLLTLFTLSNFGTQSVIPAICIMLYFSKIDDKIS